MNNNIAILIITVSGFFPLSGAALGAGAGEKSAIHTNTFRWATLGGAGPHNFVGGRYFDAEYLGVSKTTLNDSHIDYEQLDDRDLRNELNAQLELSVLRAESEKVKKQLKALQQEYRSMEVATEEDYLRIRDDYYNAGCALLNPKGQKILCDFTKRDTRANRIKRLVVRFGKAGNERAVAMLQEFEARLPKQRKSGSIRG